MLPPQRPPLLHGQDHKAVIEFLVSRGLDRKQVIDGSIPLAPLEYIRRKTISRPRDGLSILHIGNFVGVSLAFITAAAVDACPDAVVVSIDPNLPHRGIVNPQAHVLEVLSMCGLLSHSLIITGYSDGKTPSNDLAIVGGYDPLEMFNRECACERVLHNLAALSIRTFDVIIIDGNHEAEHLKREIYACKTVLKPGGYLVLDDVNWEGIGNILKTFAKQNIETDGRVGVMKVD